jgi:hypothetical protein
MPRDELIRIAEEIVPAVASLVLWATGDEEDLEANLDEGLGMPPLPELNLDALPGQEG